MSTIQHSVLNGSELHEPKGATEASEGMVYVTDGAGSGSWGYLPTGWEYYEDDGADQVLSSTMAVMSNDGGGSTTRLDKAPFAIRDTSNRLWDVATNTITPIQDGDSYNLRFDLNITAISGMPTELLVTLDIGGGVGVTTPIVEMVVDIPSLKAAPYTMTVAFPVFCGPTFVANGGQIYLGTDAGTLTVSNPTLLIDMNTSGAL